MSRFSTLVAALTVLLSLTAAWAGKPTVLVINSYHADYPWVVSHNRALREKLEDRVNLVFFCMDTKRTPEEEHQGQAEHAMTMYETVKPQLVVLADDNALRYLGNHIASRGTPVIYLGVNDNPRRYLDDTTNITGVLERPLLKRSIVFLKDIMKDIHKCLLLFDNSTTSHALVEVVFHGRKSVSFAETETDITLATTFAQWEKAVRNARDDGYNAIILGLYQSLKDEDGKHIPATTVARWTSANSPVPMFCFWDFAVGKGLAVGGLVLAGEPQGEAAAELVIRILNGENPKEIPPVTAEHGRFIFSKSELERWHLEVPAGLARPEESVEYVD